MSEIVNNRIRLTLGTSLIIYGVIENILYEEYTDEEGKIRRKERELPFRLKYRLTRSKTVLDKDLKFIDTQKMYILARYGEPTEDNKNIEIKDEEKLKLYKESVYTLLNTEVEHNVIKTEMEDLDSITANINVSAESLKLFIGYMTNDPLLIEDLNTKIDFHSTQVEDKSLD